MNTAQIPMPGALRLRNVHALDAEDGSCDLIYDLERGMVLEVPIDLQAYVALALDRTEPTDEMLSWLVREDLLTSDRFSEGAGEEDFGLAGGWSGSLPDREWLFDRPTEAEAIERLEGIFHGGERLPVRIRCHWPVDFPGVDALRRIVFEARRLAAESRRSIAFEITLALPELDEATVRYLAGESFPLRVLAGSLAPAPEGMTAVAADLTALAARFGDRLTLGVELVRGTRLRDAWHLAETAGVRHLDVAWVPGTEPRLGGELRDLESDIQHIADDICTCLRANRAPIDFQPLTRFVGRLLQREPMFDFEREPSRRPAWIGDVDSSWGLRGMAPPAVAQLWASVGEFWSEPGAAMPCEGCWARYLCPESRLLPTFAEASEPKEERCHLLRAQFEAGVRLHHRLTQMDPLATHTFLELALRSSSDPRRGAIGMRSFG
ncbi:MAG TPA: hypothetical protein VN851_19875 [Thermoanaerobaculia bacterium]|nr:hypothetical protein [Thermoanaerobaculia bacterium]